MVREYNTLSIDILRTKYSYDPETGLVYSHKTGRPLSSIDPHGYLKVTICGVGFRVHRVAWALYYGKWPEGEVDHRDRVRTNNRIKNLRVVGDGENMFNRSLQKNNKSGFMGVSYCRKAKKWRAQIEVGGKNIYLGSYDTPEEADRAYRLYKIDAHRI